MKLFFHRAGFVLIALLLGQFCCRAETVSIVIAANAAPRVQFGVEKIAEALESVKMEAVIVHYDEQKLSAVLTGSLTDAAIGKKIYVARLKTGGERESFILGQMMVGEDATVMGNDDSGVLYGCLELAKRIRAEGKLPANLQFSDKPTMALRGTCVGMQKTFILPGRKVYEYPYTPELFPWFYDKKLWTEYLDFLAANRMNTLYLWSGHPFASLVRLKDYPYAVEVSEEVFKKNQEQFRWLAGECDKRGIWLVQMFYNIIVSKPFAETNHISTQLSAPTPLVADYTRKSIAEFVIEFPNVGLMVCLGEALQGASNQVEWATKTILPGVLEGMRAANLKEQPPIVIRTHAMDAEAIMPACFQVYSNLFTETKYNGESLTTYEPRGKAAQTHLAMAKLGPHLVNIHILSNLEPFRYGATEFIRKSVLASRDRLGASGIHLYPLSYWNWPYSPDIADPPLLQWERDWIWFEAWARYAWNPDVNTNEDRAYWISRLTEKYGNTNAAEKILDAYNNMGEVAPRLIRRFGITEGNRQTLSLGMTLDQLVNPNKYGAIEDLWLSQAPPGERLDEYIAKEKAKKLHVGETPLTVISEVAEFSMKAEEAIKEASPLVTRNREEFERLSNDVKCISTLAAFFAAKLPAASAVLFQSGTTNSLDVKTVENGLRSSVEAFEQLTKLTEKSYRFANSMQTSQRKIPVSGGAGGKGTNYLWSQLLPVYQKELEDFRAKVEQLKLNTNTIAAIDESKIKPWPVAQFKLISTNAEIYKVESGAKVFIDRNFTIQQLAPQLNGLTGIRFSHAQAKDGLPPVEFEVFDPVQVLVGYFDSDKKAWLQVPKLEFAAQADERGGVDVVLENAAAISECPDVNLHAFRFDAGRQKLELIGKGSFVILGVVPQSVKLK